MLLTTAMLLLAPSAVSQNPIAGKTLYINPSYDAELDQSIATETDPAIKAVCSPQLNFPFSLFFSPEAQIEANTRTSSYIGRPVRDICA